MMELGKKSYTFRERKRKRERGRWHASSVVVPLGHLLNRIYFLFSQFERERKRRFIVLDEYEMMKDGKRVNKTRT